MRSLLPLLAILLTTGNSLAGDLLTMAFDKTTIKVDGKDQKCRMYYVLIGTHNKLEEGTILQLSQLVNHPEHCGLRSGRFKLNLHKRQLTILWDTSDRNEVGMEEHVRILDGSSKNRLILQTTRRDGESQVGPKQGVCLIAPNVLPEWAREAAMPYVLRALPPDEKLRLQNERVLLEMLDAEILRMQMESARAWLENI